MFLLDVSRTFARGKGARPTGIDRVEHAYIKHFAENYTCNFCIVRNGSLFSITKDFILEFIDQQIDGAASTAPELQEISDVDGCVFLNVSHHGVNEDHPVISLPGKRQYIFFLHDLIPIQNPEHVRPGDDIQHEKRLLIMSGLAKLIICNSNYTMNSLKEWAQKCEIDLPRLVVCPLAASGNMLYKPSAINLAHNRPYFIYVSTIEPRKNHITLLHTWRRLIDLHGDRTPDLVLVGKRGWNNEDTFRYIDQNSKIRKRVRELGSVSDETLWYLIANARALLFPSVNEGWGLPVSEAQLFNKTLVCSDIPALREASAGEAIFLDPFSVQQWVETVSRLTQEPEPFVDNISKNKTRWTWKDHFSIIDKVVTEEIGEGF